MSMKISSLKKPLAIVASLAMLALAPTALAGEDEDDLGPTQAGEVAAQTPPPTPAPPTPIIGGSVAVETLQPATPVDTTAPAAPVHVNAGAQQHGNSSHAAHNNGANAVAASQGGRDTRVPSGGVQTGLGGLASAADTDMTLPLSLLGGGMLVVTAAGLAAFRRRYDG
jgi:hypothetical protein